jgi:hypothetical protein
MKRCPRGFNPKLTTWLNNRDFVSGDWPHNLPESVKREAEQDLNRGRRLNECGQPMRKKRKR